VCSSDPEGYDRRSFKPGRESQVQGPFGGVPYLGCALDFVKNLSLHSLHQRSPDRQGWARRVLNLKTYLPRPNPLGLKGGVWRAIKISPGFKGIARISSGVAWSQVRAWSADAGGVRKSDVKALSREQRTRAANLQKRLVGVLAQQMSKLAGGRVLQQGYHFSEGYLFYGDLAKVQAKYYKKSARYALELAGHIIIRNHGEMLTGGEVGILGKGLGKGAVFLR
jgi:hypothetical protein